MLPWRMGCGRETGLNGGNYSLMGQAEIKASLNKGLVYLLGLVSSSQKGQPLCLHKDKN